MVKKKKEKVPLQNNSFLSSLESNALVLDHWGNECMISVVKPKLRNVCLPPLAVKVITQTLLTRVKYVYR